MSEPVDVYVDGIKKSLGNYFAAWLPTTRLEPGDVGVLERKGFLRKRNFFKKITTLKQLGIEYKVEPDTSSAPIDLASETGVTLHFKVAGTINTSLPHIPEASAGIGFEFSDKGAYVVKAPESYEPYIADLYQLSEKILGNYEKEDWKKEWVFVTRSVQAPSASFIISQSSESKIELEVSGDVNIYQVNLGDLDIQFGPRYEQGRILKILGAKDVSPFFQLAGMKMFPFSRPVVDPVMRRFEEGIDAEEYDDSMIEGKRDDYYLGPIEPE